MKLYEPLPLRKLNAADRALWTKLYNEMDGFIPDGSGHLIATSEKNCIWSCGICAKFLNKKESI